MTNGHNNTNLVMKNMMLVIKSRLTWQIYNKKSGNKSVIDMCV